MTIHPNRRMVWVLSTIVVGMLGLSFAAVPFYRWFCQVTGFGGTTQRAFSSDPNTITDHLINIRFNADVNPSLSWDFRPVQLQMTVPIGKTELAFYQATNRSDESLVGQATFNVTPDKAGIYFSKIACFCFEEQILRAGETVDMPVSFFIDPAFLDDPNMKDVTSITLSYTFFRAPDNRQPTAAAGSSQRPY